MLRPSRKALLAVEAVLDVAFHAGTEPVPSRDIAGRQGIPQRYLEQVLQQLVRAGVLVGVRGPRGGYRLARERRRISVGEVVRVVGRTGGRADAAGSTLGRLVVQPLWQDLQGDVLARLDGVSVEDLCDRAHGAGIGSAAAARLDYTI